MNGREVRVYSLAKDGNKKLSTNFKVREFRCKDGTDTIFISDVLIAVLQNVRDHFGKAVTISSGYRTDNHNKACGGASYSQHKYGMAADIKVSGVNAKDVYSYLDDKYPDCYGLGLDKNYVHIDVRTNRSRWVY